MLKFVLINYAKGGLLPVYPAETSVVTIWVLWTDFTSFRNIHKGIRRLFDGDECVHLIKKYENK